MNTPRRKKPHLVQRGERYLATSFALAEQLALDHTQFVVAIDAMLPHVPSYFREDIFRRKEGRDRHGQLRVFFEIARAGFILLPIDLHQPGASGCIVSYLRAFSIMENALEAAADAEAALLSDEELAEAQAREVAMNAMVDQAITNFRGVMAGLGIQRLQEDILRFANLSDAPKGIH